MQNDNCIVGDNVELCSLNSKNRDEYLKVFKIASNFAELFSTSEELWRTMSGLIGTDSDRIVRFAIKNSNGKRICGYINYELTLEFIENIIGQLNNDILFDMQNCKYNKNRILIGLIDIVKNKYVDESGKTLEKYRVASTSKLDRECYTTLLCRNNDLISNTFSEYENGNIEIIEACDKTIENLKNKLVECDRERNIKLESSINRMYSKILAFASMNSFEEYSDSKYQKIMNQISEYKQVVGQDDMIHRFLLFFLEEIEMAVKEKDKEKMETLFTDWVGLKNYVWFKI